MKHYREFIFVGILVLLSTPAFAEDGPFAITTETLSLELFSEFDQFGNQFSVVQTWSDANGPRTTFSIYDTGASVVTLSPGDQALFGILTPGQEIPIKKEGGASATAVGGSGSLTGNTSNPGNLRVAGMSAFQFDPNNPLDYGVSLDAGIEVPGIQMFVGTDGGSPALPTIAGTPVHLPTTTTGNQGSAALIDMRGYKLDLGAMFGDALFQDILLDMPDVQFKDRGHQIFGKTDTYVPVSIPITLYGEDNSLNPGDVPTHSYNPVVESVVPSHQGVSDPGQRFLFDTGAQLSVISTATAIKLGLDLDNPQDTIDVQGASGTAEIPGFVIDSLLLPRDGGFLEFTKVPVYVLDIGEGIDGILGMNLFNGADEILYDPFRDGGPYLGVTFLHERTLEFEEGLIEEMEGYQQEVAALQALLAEFAELDIDDLAGDGLDLDLNMLTGAFGSRFAINGVVSIGAQMVPEPNSAILASLGLAMLASWRRRGFRRRVV